MTNPWTPGPWYAGSSNGYGETPGWEIEDEKYTIALAIADIDILARRAEANARLIAAAPEMAEVLERLVVMLDRQERPGGLSDTRVVEARALLARIRGDAT
jgi:hypothetical protein